MPDCRSCYEAAVPAFYSPDYGAYYCPGCYPKAPEHRVVSSWGDPDACTLDATQAFSVWAYGRRCTMEIKRPDIFDQFAISLLVDGEERYTGVFTKQERYED